MLLGLLGILRFLLMRYVRVFIVIRILSHEDFKGSNDFKFLRMIRFIRVSMFIIHVTGSIGA